MNIEDFKTLIKNNSKKGKKTEFLKFTISIDDYRKSKPADYGIEETFFADYDKNNKIYIIYYPDKDKEIKLDTDAVEEVFYSKKWGICIHK